MARGRRGARLAAGAELHYRPGMRMFLDCGWAAWLILAASLFAMISAVVAIVLAATKKRAAGMAGVVTLALGLSVAGLGFVGEAWGRNLTDSAVSLDAIDPGQRERIRHHGYAEAAQCRSLGFIASPLPTLVGLICAVLGFAIKPRPS